MSIKIGFLLPRSDAYPTLAKDFLNGIKLSLNNSLDQDNIPKFFIEGVGTASDDSLIKTAEKLLLQEDIDLAIGFCSAFLLKKLGDVFTSYKKPFIHVDLGGRVIKKEHITPYVFHYTLHLWHSSYEAGKYAAINFGKKILVCGSYYDSGYQITQAFVNGVMEEGGEVVSYWIAPMDYKSQNFDGMIQAVEEISPDSLFCLFSYNEGKVVFEKLAASDINDKVPIIVNPLMTEDITNNYNLKNIISVASWSFDDDNVEMKNFIEAYKNKYEENPNVIALMGYEVGQIVSESLSENSTIPNKIGEHLANKTMNIPRGRLTANHYFESTLDTFKVREFIYNKEQYHNTIIKELSTASVSNQYKNFEEAPYVGWQNPYICT